MKYGSRPFSRPTPRKYSSGGPFVDAQQLGDVTLAGGDLVLELAGFGVVQVELAPVIALRKPDDLLGGRQVLPVGAAVARFVEAWRRPLRAHREPSPVAASATRSVLVLVVARSRDERQVLRRRDSTERRSIPPGRRCRRTTWSGAGREAYPAGPRAGSSTSITTRWMVVTTSSPGSGYFHASQRGMPDLRIHQVHFADAALILLEGRDLLRIGRPEDDGAVARASSRRCRWRTRNP